jgi:hypothetical protein
MTRVIMAAGRTGAMDDRVRQQHEDIRRGVEELRTICVALERGEHEDIRIAVEELRRICVAL